MREENAGRGSLDEAETLDAGDVPAGGDLELGGRLLPVQAGSQPLFCLDWLPAPKPCQVGPSLSSR